MTLEGPVARLALRNMIPRELNRLAPTLDQQEHHAEESGVRLELHRALYSTIYGAAYHPRSLGLTTNLRNIVEAYPTIYMMTPDRTKPPYASSKRIIRPASRATRN